MKPLMDLCQGSSIPITSLYNHMWGGEWEASLDFFRENTT